VLSDSDTSIRFTESPSAKRSSKALVLRKRIRIVRLLNFPEAGKCAWPLPELLYEEPDLLLLDEPTNHLDLEHAVVPALSPILTKAPSFISHDRAFINSIVDRIVEVRDHAASRYTGTFEDYLERTAERKDQSYFGLRTSTKEIERN